MKHSHFFKIITISSILTLALCLTSCKEKKENGKTQKITEKITEKLEELKTPTSICRLIPDIRERRNMFHSNTGPRNPTKTTFPGTRSSYATPTSFSTWPKPATSLARPMKRSDILKWYVVAPEAIPTTRTSFPR